MTRAAWTQQNELQRWRAVELVRRRMTGFAIIPQQAPVQPVGPHHRQPSAPRARPTRDTRLRLAQMLLTGEWIRLQSRTQSEHIGKVNLGVH